MSEQTEGDNNYRDRCNFMPGGGVRRAAAQLAGGFRWLPGLLNRVTRDDA